MNPVLSAAYFGWFAFKADRAQLWRNLARTQAMTGRSKAWLWRDLLGSVLRRGNSFDDYFTLRFAEKSPTERATYITARDCHQHQRRSNSRSQVGWFRDKARFAQRFRRYLRRETCDLESTTPADAIAWLSRHDRVIAKPPRGMRGIGVRKIDVAEAGGPEAARSHFMASPVRYLEEVIQQHPEVARFNPGSVNTVRVITVARKDRVQVLGARFGIGTTGAADNLTAGGVAAAVELETGRLGPLFGPDPFAAQMERHPISGVQVEGAVLPNWSAVLELACEAARVVPDVTSVGWDIAILSDGACLVEGNDNWGHTYVQILAGRGLKSEIER